MVRRMNDKQNEISTKAVSERALDKRANYDDLFYEAELSLAMLADALQDDGLTDMSTDIEELSDRLTAMLRSMIEGE